MFCTMIPGHYLYLDVRKTPICNGVLYNVFPRLPPDTYGVAKCLSFEYNMYGDDIGSLSVMDGHNMLMWTTNEQTVRDGKSVWMRHEVTLSPSQRLFAFKMTRGGNVHEDRDGKISIDNIMVVPLSCDGNFYIFKITCFSIYT